MRLGVALPTSGRLASPAAITQVAQAAEEIGYATAWTYERLLRPIAAMPQADGSAQRIPEYYRLTFEPLETLSFVAALTSRIGLGTSVIDALLHPPVVLARRFATLDQLSGGRAVAGLGQGWMPQEFQTANVPMERIGAGLDDVVAALRACWGPDPVSYTGRYHTIPESEVNPKPVQERLPVLIGAMTPAGIRRAVRIADGINPIAVSKDALAGMLAVFRDAVNASGRDPDQLQVVVRVNGPITTEPMGSGRPYLGGSPDEIAADLAELEGVDEVMFSNGAPVGLEEHLGLLARLHAVVLG